MKWKYQLFLCKQHKHEKRSGQGQSTIFCSLIFFRNQIISSFRNQTHSLEAINIFILIESHLPSHIKHRKMHPVRYEMAEQCWADILGCCQSSQADRVRAAIPGGFLADPFAVGILAGGGAGLGYPRENSFLVHPLIPLHKGVSAEPEQKHRPGGTEQSWQGSGQPCTPQQPNPRFRGGNQRQESARAGQDSSRCWGIWMGEAGNCSGVRGDALAAPRAASPWG